MNKLLRSVGYGSPSWPYVAPFVTFLVLLGLAGILPGGPGIHYPLRVVLVTAVVLVWSRDVIQIKPSRWVSSIVVGAAVFLVWIGPDALWPAYRTHWLLQNPLTGSLASTVTEPVRASFAFLAFRVAGSVILVPVVEELFWRAWLMRWLISRRFESLPLGSWTAGSFWITAVLFAVEHGPFWDVGLAAGVIYNWWMIRTRSLADCILAHAVTNNYLKRLEDLVGVRIQIVSVGPDREETIVVQNPFG